MNSTTWYNQSEKTPRGKSTDFKCVFRLKIGDMKPADGTAVKPKQSQVRVSFLLLLRNLTYALHGVCATLSSPALFTPKQSPRERTQTCYQHI